VNSKQELLSIGKIFTLERFVCSRCGVVIEEPSMVQQVRETGICPACGTGGKNENPGWTSTKGPKK